jgi:hypothetical protein
MSDTPRYYTPKPIEIWREGDDYCAFLFDDLSDDPGYRTFDEKYLDEHFTPLDIEQLHQQYKEIFAKAVDAMYICSEEEEYEAFEKQAIAELLALQGITEDNGSGLSKEETE